ncbi:MAG: hypothetical protein HYR87_07505 [Thaumarchaeota archaeon]|nr:hypothetical protein [Nitrososphaerota archaeon]
MRIKIEGTRTPRELGGDITGILESVLGEYSGLKIKNFNLYFNVVDEEGEEVELCSKDGRPIQMLLVPDKNKPKKMPKKKYSKDNIVQMPDPNIVIKTEQK